MMASKLTDKVRLVKCPKCRLVLLESPDLDVYQCGGCHTTLQAKKRVNGAKIITSGLHDTKAVETDKPDRVSECKEHTSSPSSSSSKEILPNSGESPSYQINGQDQNRSSGDFDIEHLGGVESSKEEQNDRIEQNDCLDCNIEQSEVSNNVCPSIEVDGNEKGELGDNENEDLADNEIENLADNKNEDLDDHGIEDLADNENVHLADNDNNHLAGNKDEDLADNEFKTEDLADDEIGDLADNEHDDDLAVNDNKDPADNGDKEHLADNEDEFPDKEHEEFSYKENGEFGHENGHFADNENESSEDTENEAFACNSKGDSADNENEFEDNENGEFAYNETQEFSHKKNEDFGHNKNEESLSLPGTDLRVAKNDESSPSTQADKVDINRNGDSNLESSSTVNLEARVGNGSIVSTDRPVEHRISSDTFMSSPSERLEQPKGSVHQGFGHLRSVETSETMELNPSSELSGTLRDMSKSSTMKSAHAYDGSISSYDGIDDPLPNPHMHSFQDTCKDSHFVRPEERSRRDRFLVSNMKIKDSQMPYQVRNSWSDKKKHVPKHNKSSQDEFLEPPRYGHKVRNWTRLERDEYQPRLVIPQIGPRPGYESGSLSSQLYDEFHGRNSGFQSSDLSEDLEQDKMKLMRMIFELQDQLNKTLSLHEMGNDGMSVASRMPRYVPRYHNYDTSEEEHFHQSNYPRYGRYGARISYSQQQHRSMQIPFSGEATSSGHQVDPSCLHCRPQDWHHPAQFPPPLPYNNNRRYRIHPGHNCSTSYNSCPSSPQCFVDSEYPVRIREALSDEQRRKSHEVKSYLREKPHLVKRHLRPVAGGAPFITCYKCFKLLQLPADFLLFKRRSHRLRCGGCSQVLKFSICEGSSIVPYTMNAMDPPPSEVGDCSGAIDTRGLPSTSQANEFLYADPVSCSDDYGHSHCQSCSTEGDLVSTTFHTHQGSIDAKKMPNGSYDPTRGKQEMVSMRSANKYKNSLLRDEHAGPSSSISKVKKFSSEIEQLPTRSGSPLYRLMDYSSPSQVIYGSEPSRRRTNPYSMQKETETRN